MNNHTALQPTLCIDFKKNRIRIHKCTLHMLGDPEYIQILVNPDKHMLALRKSRRTDHSTHHVKICCPDSKYCYELYSFSFMQNLCRVSKRLKNNQSYRLYGEINTKEGIARFSINDCIMIDNDENEEILP